MSNSCQQKSITPQQKGITLLETVLYMALFSLFMSMSLPLLIEHDTWQTKQEHELGTVEEYETLRLTLDRAVFGGAEILLPQTDHSSNHFLADIEPDIDIEIGTSSSVRYLLFERTEGGVNFETLQMGAEINKINFGTTTYVLFED
jgi:hypothetical protein